VGVCGEAAADAALRAHTSAEVQQIAEALTHPIRPT
jgi:hypothetical protein